MRCWPSLAVAATVSLTAACGDNAAVIEVDGDLQIPADVDGLCLAVDDRAAGGGRFASYYTLGDDIASLPQTLTVEPGAADAATASARGYRWGLEVARDRRSFDFGGVIDVELELVRCPGGDRGVPEVAGSATLPEGARFAVSFGRGGSSVVVVGAGATASYRAGDGLAAATAALPAPLPTAPRALVALDADADCDDDLLVVPADAPPVLWRRDGGDFAEVADAFDGAGLGLQAVAASADVDGDGDADLIVGGGAALRLLRNDGTGRFQVDPAAIPGDAVTDVTALAAGDIDGDGNVDLVAGQGGATAAPSRVLLNDPSGTGSFVAQPAALPELPLRVRSLAIADVNGDSAADLVVGAVAEPVRLYVNRGDGRLEDRSFVTLPDGAAVDATAVAARDWDGDCLPDIAVATGTAPLSWRGSDTGAFVAETVGGASGDQLVLADIDGDGDADLLIADDTVLTWMRR